MAETRVIWENDSYVGQSLTPDEVATLEDNVFNVIAKDSDDLTSLYRDNWGKIQGALQVAKDQLSATYGGFSASDGEIGVSMIRPGHLLRDANTTETADFQNWTRTFTADGDYWIGYDATHSTAINVDARIGAILILGVYFSQGNAVTVSNLYWQIGATTYLREDLSSQGFSGQRLARIRPKLLEKKGTALVQTWSAAAGTQDMAAIGLTFATGAFLRLEDPTSVQT